MLGLRTCIYHVDNIDAAKTWYTKAFNKTPYFDEPFYVGFNIDGYELGLQANDPKAGTKITSVVCYWGVDDIQKAFDRLIEIGATSNNEPTNVGGELMVASVKDPWGNVLGIIYNPYFKLEE